MEENPEFVFKEFSITVPSQNNPRLISISGDFPNKKEHSFKLVGELLDILTELDSDSAHMPIILTISSRGGSTDTYFPLLERLGKLRSPLHTIAKNIVGSAAALIFISGAKGHRYIYSKSCLILHKTRSFIPCFIGDVLVDYKECTEQESSIDSIRIRAINQQIACLLYERTDGKILDAVPGGRDCEDDEAKRTEAILSFLDQDRGFPADIAVQYGLADHIIEE